MAKKELINLVDEHKILNKIFYIKGVKVMLDKDLAEMYKVETRVLNQAIKRNERRFPKDFMFQLNDKEFKNLISQNVTSSWGWNPKITLCIYRTRSGNVVKCFK